MAKLCVVSFKDRDGFRHSVEVVAEGLYEAAALVAQRFANAGCPPLERSELEIQVRAPEVDVLDYFAVTAWVNGVAKSPAEKLAKERLKGLLKPRV